MTYVRSQKRWTKHYKGRSYSVSCKEFGCPPSKEQSATAANRWWEKKQAEIDGEDAARQARQQAPEVLAEEKIDKALDGLDFGELHDLIERGEAARRLLLTMEGIEADPERRLNPDDVVEEMHVGTLSQARERLRGNVPQGRTIQAQVEEWQKLLRASVAQKVIDPGRLDAYQRNIGVFAKWAGPESPVEVITAVKLEQYWTYLAQQVTEGRWSPAYAKVIFMTFKQFACRLAEVGLIPLPGNIRSRRFKFGDGPKAIERLSLGEVKALLGGCKGFSERTELYVLLMLNCGMYLSDISDLAVEEVDWSAGRLRRPRSKTPDGPVVTYRLWPETLDLLKKHRAKGRVPNERGGHRALLSDEGKQLVCYWMEGGKLRRYDLVQSAFSRLFERVGWKRPIKLLRKTSASELGGHATFGAYVQHFLGHSPRGVTDRHYVVPDQDRFDEALVWLRSRYLAE